MDSKLNALNVSVYRVPTDGPESDGTLEWDCTTLVLVEAHAGSTVGVGFTYARLSTALVINEVFRPVLMGRDVLDVRSAWETMIQHSRNLGRPGIVSMAVSAVDVALWDLKARLLDLPLVSLLGRVRDGIPVYGSGGFTSYNLERLQRQLANWAASGFSRVKMKVGRDLERDLARVRAAREAIGSGCELFVDANGAYSRKQALSQARVFEEAGVSWFEEPVTSDDLEGLRFVRKRAPASMVIAAGEYGYDAVYFRRMLSAGAVDILQADATRCGGFTGFLQAASLCDAFLQPLSAHTAPSIHAHLCCALPRACNLEYFYDHYRIEQMFFDGTVEPVRGLLVPDLTRPGLGLEFKRSDAGKFLVAS